MCDTHRVSIMLYIGYICVWHTVGLMISKYSVAELALLNLRRSHMLVFHSYLANVLLEKLKKGAKNCYDVAD